MPDLLEILTAPEDEFTRNLRGEARRALGAGDVDCFEFGPDEPDYDDLLRRIFSAHRVQVWSPPLIGP
jgi:hypothetical protein